VCKIVHTCFAAATEFSFVFLMADTSSYSIEERLVASVWVHERQHTGQTMFQVMAAFRERFNGHVTKAYVSDSNQFMVAYWSVYGDFSATLYNVKNLNTEVETDCNLRDTNLFLKCNSN
jgi:hypothetical protein